jgi:hypothetical protein
MDLAAGLQHEPHLGRVAVRADRQGGGRAAAERCRRIAALRVGEAQLEGVVAEDDRHGRRARIDERDAYGSVLATRNPRHRRCSLAARRGYRRTGAQRRSG